MKLSAAILAILLAGAGAGAAPAQTAKAKSVEACLASPNTDVCLGVVSSPCIGPDEGAKRDSEVIACLDGEQRQWDKVLNTSFQALLKGLEPAQQKKLREMQRMWLLSRASTCNFYQDYFDGTMANPMIANCMNRETARRAIFLKGFADDMAQRK
ncbi:MAG: DUF1311 domain-containing protein [Xanthobacteraceae bacterium]|nr:DUF1311 domain-containing protein [Xanthobacteraceae bacterium]